MFQPASLLVLALIVLCWGVFVAYLIRLTGRFRWWMLLTASGVPIVWFWALLAIVYIPCLVARLCPGT